MPLKIKCIDTEQDCVGCHNPADMFVGKRLNGLTNLTVDNAGVFLCAMCFFLRPGWRYLEANR